MTPPFDLRHVEVFLALCEELRFARVAERTGLTPSRVSQTIRTLESRVGGRLFERTSRRVTLTPLGERLRADLEPAYEQLVRAYANARESATGVAGKLRLAMYAPMSGGAHLLEIITAFEGEYPACRVETIDTGRDLDVIGRLRGGDADLAATRLPLTDPGVIVGPILSRDARVVLLAADHELATRTSIVYDDLADETVNEPPTAPREMMDAFIPPLTSSGRRPRRVHLGTLSEVMLEVSRGKLAHLTVSTLTEHYVAPGVVAVPIRDLPRSETALVWLRVDDSPAIRAFAQTAERVMDPYLEPVTPAGRRGA